MDIVDITLCFFAVQDLILVQTQRPEANKVRVCEGLVSMPAAKLPQSTAHRVLVLASPVYMTLPPK